MERLRLACKERRSRRESSQTKSPPLVCANCERLRTAVFSPVMPNSTERYLDNPHTEIIIGGRASFP